MFGKFVANKRKSLNWTQVDLASYVGNNFQNISRLERGEITPSFYWVFQLSIVFDQNCSDLINEFENTINNKLTE